MLLTIIFLLLLSSHNIRAFGVTTSSLRRTDKWRSSPPASALKEHQRLASVHSPLFLLPETSAALLATEQPTIDVVEPLSRSTATVVFIVGVIPFAIATYEFWRRIAVGASFGTNEPVVFFIGEDDNRQSSRGRQVLGRDSLITAYVIFTVVGAVLALVITSVLTTPPVSDLTPPDAIL